MRKAALALALVASAQLTVLSSTAKADSSSDKARTGWILVGAGGAVAIGGIVIDGIGAGTAHVAGAGGPGDTANTDNTRRDLYFLGTTMIVAGLVACVYGGSLVVNANRSDTPTSAPPPADDARNDASKSLQARLASTPAFMMPVIGATF